MTVTKEDLDFVDGFEVVDEMINSPIEMFEEEILSVLKRRGETVGNSSAFIAGTKAAFKNYEENGPSPKRFRVMPVVGLMIAGVLCYAGLYWLIT